MSEAGARVLYEFNDFRLDPQQRLLLTAGGEPIPLAPKVFDTLLYFIERRGELLDKSTLLKAVWPNVVVEENSLNQNISALRRALKEGPNEHRFIVTEPGRGYRFVAEVRTVTAEAPAGPAVRQAAAPSSRKSIAVLPFANLTGDPAKDYLGDGLAEELIHTLARIPNLRVPSRTSAFAYKGRNVDLRQIARDLDVAAVLEGSVRTAGDRIRVTAQLIDGDTGFHRWSQSYDRDMGDLFRLQDELASAIVATLRISLDSGLPATLLQAPTRNIEAYHLYLQAIAVQATPNPTAIERAIEMLRRALELDPRFARAHSGLAFLRATSIVMDVRFPDRLDDIEQDALRALALDPDTGTTHGALGTIRTARGQWVDAESSFQMALRLDPEDAYLHQSYGVFLAGSVGFSARFLEAELTAHRLAPAWIVNLMATAVAYYTVDRPDEARKYIQLAVDLGIHPTVGPVPDLLAQLDVRDGQLRPRSCASIRFRSPRIRRLACVKRSGTFLTRWRGRSRRRRQSRRWMSSGDALPRSAFRSSSSAASWCGTRSLARLPRPSPFPIRRSTSSSAATPSAPRGASSGCRRCGRSARMIGSRYWSHD